MTSQLTEQSTHIEAERKKCDELSGDLRRTQVEKESFERQVIMTTQSSRVQAHWIVKQLVNLAKLIQYLLNFVIFYYKHSC